MPRLYIAGLNSVNCKTVLVSEGTTVGRRAQAMIMVTKPENKNNQVLNSFQ